MSRVLYIDGFSGIAGDMLLGAFLDLGMPLPVLEGALGSLGVDHALRVSRVLRAGVSATHVSVEERDGRAHHYHHDHSHDHHHRHDHDHDHQTGGSHHHGPAPHGHRSLGTIARLIDGSALSGAGKERAKALFRRIGEAEAAIHGVSLDDVHLHEVGALDSIIDIVGAVCAFEWLAADEVIASPLNVGGGIVETAHGRFPVPAPATLRLLAGVPVYSSGVQAELVTPTGALLVSGYAGAFGPMPGMTIEAAGYGAGTRDLAGTPNVVRLVVGRRDAGAAEGAAEGAAGGSVVQIECEIDDMSPQLTGALVDRLLSAGALDAFLTPVIMKKGRPGVLVTILAPSGRVDSLVDVVFRESTTLGVRSSPVTRRVLDRRHEAVAVFGHPVRLKVSGRSGEVLTVTPEFDDCARVAAETGRAIRDVQAEALEAWRGGRGRTG
jgi:uncharacterized protein (TIGR00299 family) protein